MRVSAAPHTKPAEIVEVTLHEMVHLACPPRESHGERFRRIFARACREAWQIGISIDPPRGNRQNRSYVQGDLLVAAFGPDRTFPEYTPDPPKPKLSRAEKMDALIEKRAASAVANLKRAETRLKRAKTLHAKWKTKVAYYESQAAKRGAKS